MIELQHTIQALCLFAIFYWGIEKFHMKQSDIFSVLLLFTILYNIGSKMYAKQTIKKEILQESFIRSCVAFTTCILISSLINQYSDDKVMITFAMAIMLSTIYFLNKYYNFSRY